MPTRRTVGRRRLTGTGPKLTTSTENTGTAGPFWFYLPNGGLEFGKWIDERGGSGYTEGDVIECPPYVIEDILRRQLSQTTETIDFDGFDFSGNTTDGLIKDWKFYGSLSNIEPAEDVLQRLCLQCKSRLFRDADGIWSFWTYDTLRATSFSDYQFDKDNHITNLEISLTPASGIANTVRVNYMLDRGSGSYQRQTFIEAKKTFSGSYLNEDIDSSEYVWTVDDGGDFAADDYVLVDSEICKVSSVSGNDVTLVNASGSRTTFFNSDVDTHANNASIYIVATNSDNGNGTADESGAGERETKAAESIWRYGKTGEFVIDADFIIDDTTAQELRNHWHDYLKAPKVVIDFDTYLNASAVIVNDIIEFDDSIMDDYLKIFGRSWSGIKFVVLNIQRRGNMKFHITAEELTTDFI